ncbi:DegV family protein [Bacillus mojavensis]|uniref:DegV family protein n=1 Tax=Bacillus mojavensis TaxID=72360 RepID=UPI00028922F1|nr:DegV family protein [Bacillus mojavensis]MDR4227117.1 DegV family protein [Bacillus mojavensis]MEC3587777.1 DegV family protein [Bacillus mojavensis]MEC5244254.1 DegV family protein [Bacillus mojavensis]MED0750512.1 DegV family protein [Bacillus mojavensis]
MTVHLIADSAADLPRSYFEENGLGFIPLRVSLGDKEYEDAVTIHAEQIFEAMQNGEAPKTSQASPQTIKNVFLQYAETGEPALYIAFSSGLSGTYQTAVMIANEVKEEFPDFDLRVIDSKCASLGYGLAVLHARELCINGNTIQEIETSVKNFCAQLEHIFTVDDLTYLARGGRISKTSAFVGGLLNIKPLLHMEDGKLVPLEKIRGQKKLFKRIIELMKDRGDNWSDQTVGISYAANEGTANEMKQLIEDAFKPKDIIMHSIGSAVGSHSGPGTLAIFFLGRS